MSDPATASQVAIARLFGDLLLQELDRQRLDELCEPELAAALASVGIEVPQLTSCQAIDELAAEYFSTFVRPEGTGPLVQSLWQGGQYEGEPALVVRQLAEAAGLEFERELARGAPLDHLGSLLHLWADTRESVPEVAERLRAYHFAWSLGPLERVAQGSGFYAQVAGALSHWMRGVISGQG